MVELVSALHELSGQRGELPDPLPESPSLPYEYLQRLGAVIRGTADLDRSTQAAAVFELRTALDTEDDPAVRDDVHELLQVLRSRPEVTYPVVKEIDSILDKSNRAPKTPLPDTAASGDQSTVRAPAQEVNPDVGRAPVTTSDRPSNVPDDRRVSTPAAASPGHARWNRRLVVACALAVVVVVAALLVGYFAIRPAFRSDLRGSRQVELPLTGLNYPVGVAVDHACDVYVADTGNNRVVKVVNGTNPIVLPSTGLNHPTAVTVGPEGLVFVADTGNNRVVQLPPGATRPAEVPATGLNNPEAVAVGSAGHVFVADAHNNRIVRLDGADTGPTQLPFTGLNNPTGLALDSAGAVYVSDSGNNRVLKLLPKN